MAASNAVSTGLSIMDMPVEIRLDIYEYLFQLAKVVLDVGNSSSSRSCLVPEVVKPERQQVGRSSQLLRVCKAILNEAQPVLYRKTTFHVIAHTFAGSLPSSLGNGNVIAKYARHVVWQLDCDIMKKYYREDFAFQRKELAMLDSLEIIAKVDTWKGSFCGEDCDRDGFVRGRQGMLEYSKLLWAQFKVDGVGLARLVEDQRCLGKGEVRIRLERSIEQLGSSQVLLCS